MTNNNQTWEERWDNSALEERISESEFCAINHGFPEWHGQTIKEFIASELQTQKLELLNKLEEELPKSNKHYWLDGVEQDLIYRQQVINLLNKQRSQ